MDRKELEWRTKRFHIDVIRLCGQMPKTAVGFELTRQLCRAAGSVGANYRASRRAKSKADFSNKVKIVLEESDESHYWLEVIRETELITGREIDRLIREANELTAIFTAMDKTASQKKATP
ncbi:MAG: four helix bundle protein [Chitinophagaceae bacterium]|nr:MAG: four helix bundle protein [Chitinophagaceae bacterium]